MNQLKNLRYAVALSLGLLASGLTTGTYAGAELSWTGCGVSKHAFMDDMATAYEAKTGVKLKLTGGGATKGIRTVAAGTSDVGGTCRYQLKDTSGVHTEEKGAKLVQVAWDALVVVVNPENPISNITLDQIKKIYDGEITEWKQLDPTSPLDRIALVEREDKDAGVGRMFRLLAWGDGDHEFTIRTLKEKESAGAEQKLEKVKGGLAIAGVSSARKREASGQLKVLTLDGIASSKENIVSAKYPLIRPLFVTMPEANVKPEAKQFLNFVLSDNPGEGQEVISKAGTVNLKEGKALVSYWDDKRKKLNF